MFHVLMH